MKHAAAGGLAPPFSKALAVALLSAGLGACGGGGGGDGGTAAPTSVESPAPAPRPAPAPTPPSPSTSTPTPEDPLGFYAPVAGSEPQPLLTAPQTGSIAAAGNGSEGFYEDMFGYAFVSASGEVARKMLFGTLWGSVTVTGSNWIFNPGARLYDRRALPVTGSGTFSANVSMDGTYSTDGRSSDAWGPMRYSTANALAVTQVSAAGTWSNVDRDTVGMSITVDDAGRFTGRTVGSGIGVCAVTGTVVLKQPDSAKNLYTLTLNATNTAATGEMACKLDSATYVGPTAVVFTAAKYFVGNGYFRNLALLLATAEGSTLSMVMRKQGPAGQG